MKNIEKYHETKAALEAYNKLDFKKVPFDEWLEREYEGTTLLEAAEAVATVWKSNLPEGSLTNIWNAIANLSEVIKLEKSKPVRNCDKYKTVKEASIAFTKMCEGTECEKCCYNNSTRRAYGCRFAWIYSEEGKKSK